MSGQLPHPEEAEGEMLFGGHLLGRHHRRKEMGVESAATSFFTGIGFVVAALAVLLYVPAGGMWWWSFLIPAFATIGKGIGQFLRWREHQRKQSLFENRGKQPIAYQEPFRAPAQVAESAAPTTSELAKPVSVTEHTTRHLE
jgi:hypothetical protein